VSEKKAEKFSKEWYNIKRRETAALWEQRQDINKESVVPLSELRSQVAENCGLDGCVRQTQDQSKVLENV
jgi:hypothetical protein